MIWKKVQWGLVAATILLAGIVLFSTTLDLAARHEQSKSPHQPGTSRQLDSREEPRGDSRPPPRFSLMRLLEPEVPTPKPPTGTRANYNSEVRNRKWAPRMERLIGERLGKANTVDLPGFALTAVDCRETTCRLEFEFPSRLRLAGLDRGAPRPGSPAQLVWGDVGPLASVSGQVDEESVMFHRDGTLMEKEVYIIQFTELDEIDPSTYEAWVNRRNKEFKERRGKKQ